MKGVEGDPDVKIHSQTHTDTLTDTHRDTEVGRKGSPREEEGLREIRGMRQSNMDTSGKIEEEG